MKLKLKHQYYGHLMQRADSIEKTQMLLKIEGREDEMFGWHHWLDGHEFEQAPGVGEEQEGLVCWSPWGRKSWTQLRDWTAWLTVNISHYREKSLP